jgi:hypothetical protein
MQIALAELKPEGGSLRQRSRMPPELEVLGVVDPGHPSGSETHLQIFPAKIPTLVMTNSAFCHNRRRAEDLLHARARVANVY